MPSPLLDIQKVFLDTSPVIYFVETHPTYITTVIPLFERIDNEECFAVISPITFSECLVAPLRLVDKEGVSGFYDLFNNSESVICLPINQNHTFLAAEIRAKYNISITDAFQFAIAIQSQCDAFLTNDKKLKRVQEIEVLLVDDLLEDWNA